MTNGIWPGVLGRFDWTALPFVRAWENPTVGELIGAGAASIVVFGGIALIVLITALGKWRHLLSLIHI